MQQAVDVAEHAGHIVYFPAGTYLDSSATPVTVAGAGGIMLEGASRTTTRILVKNAVHRPTILVVTADHVTVSDLTFDGSDVTGGGALVLVTGSDTTVEHCVITGGANTSWPLRFAGGAGTARPDSPMYMSGNRVDDLSLSDDAPSRNDGLDFSFQRDGSISDVQQFGSRLGLYVDTGVTVSDYTYRPNPAVGSGAYGFYVTDPSSDITITDFTSSGAGGRVGSTPTAHPRGPNVDITIVGERMLDPTASITIGDVTGLVIRASQLGTVDLAPTMTAEGVLEDSTYRRIVRHGAAGATVDVTTLSDSAPAPSAR